MNSYYAGSLVRVSATFSDISGTATDPTTVTLKYRQGGSVTTLTYAGAQLTKASTGNYYTDLDTTPWITASSEVITVQWTGTGTCQAVTTDQFTVTEPAL